MLRLEGLPVPIGFQLDPVVDVADSGEHHHLALVVGHDVQADLSRERAAVFACSRQLPSGTHRTWPRVAEIVGTVPAVPIVDRTRYQQFDLFAHQFGLGPTEQALGLRVDQFDCLLYTSDAADE